MVKRWQRRRPRECQLFASRRSRRQSQNQHCRRHQWQSRMRAQAKLQTRDLVRCGRVGMFEGCAIV